MNKNLIEKFNKVFNELVTESVDDLSWKRSYETDGNEKYWNLNFLIDDPIDCAVKNGIPLKNFKNEIRNLVDSFNFFPYEIKRTEDGKKWNIDAYVKEGELSEFLSIPTIGSTYGDDL